MRRALELGQPENENFGWSLGLEHRLLAAPAVRSRIMAIRLSSVLGLVAPDDAAVAGEDEIELAATRRNLRRRRKPQKARLAAALGEHAHQFLADARYALDRHPVEVLRAHHDGI